MASESVRLRHDDYRDIYQLIGECLELGVDPVLWRRHLLGRLNQMFGAIASVVIDIATDNHQTLHPAGPAAVRAINVDDLPDADRLILKECFLEMPVDGNPLALPVFRQARHKLVSAETRRNRLSERQWQASLMAREYFARLGWGDLMLGCSLSTPGTSDRGHAPSTEIRVLNLSRPKNDGRFPLRMTRKLELIMSEIQRISAVRLADWSVPSIERLPQRLREVIEALAEGDNENQIALRLGISRATVHEYVRRLYEKYDVTSRSQLMIYIARQLHASRVHKADGSLLTTTARLRKVYRIDPSWPLKHEKTNKSMDATGRFPSNSSSPRTIIGGTAE